jgi:hypothetical protein
LQQGKQRKEQNSDRGKRFYIFSPSAATWSASKLADRNLSGSFESSGNHAPTPMGDTFRRINGEGNGVPVGRRNGTPS